MRNLPGTETSIDGSLPFGCSDQSLTITSRDLLEVVVPTLFFTFNVDIDEQQIFASGELAKPRERVHFILSYDGYFSYIPEITRRFVRDLYESFFDRSDAGSGTVTLEHDFLRDGGIAIPIRVCMRSFNSNGHKRVWGAATVREVIQASDDVPTEERLEAGGLALRYDVPNGLFLLNPALRKKLEMTQSIIPGASAKVATFLHPDDREDFSRVLFDIGPESEAARQSVFRFLDANRREIRLRLNRITVETGNRVLISITARFSEVAETDSNHILVTNDFDDAATVPFIVDFDKSEITFSRKLRELLPLAELKYGGSLMQTISEYVLSEDMPNVIEPIGAALGGSIERIACEFRIRRDKEVLWLALRGKLRPDPVTKNRLLVGTLINLDNMHNYQQFADDYRNRHKVTYLPGRTMLVEATQKVLCDRNVFSAAVILADILAFQTLNDRFGRESGDHVLRTFAEHLTGILPSGADLYHMTGDTFAILWPHASRIQVDRFMHYAIEAGPISVTLEDEIIDINFSMSGALYPSCGNLAAELVENAEITLHKIKKSRKPEYALFATKDKKEIAEKLDFEIQVSRSVKKADENFLLYFQPLFSPENGSLLGAEALLRWIAPNGDIMTPERLIDGLTATGNMEQVSAFVLEKGIAQCREWLDAGVPEDFHMHINITADDLMRDSFVSEIQSLLCKYRLPEKNLMLEITETVLMKNLAVCRSNIIRLRNAGVHFSLDDFGSGYSSLNYLRELPVDEIKIDRAFLENVQRDRYNHSLVSAIILLAHSIHAKVCIEGIENIEQADTVRKLHPDLFQGFYFGRPLPPENFSETFVAS